MVVEKRLTTNNVSKKFFVFVLKIVILLLAPSRPPSNVSSEAPSPSSLRLSWKPVDKQHLNGILRAYVITYFETKSPDDSRQNITIPVTSGRKRRAISNPSSPSFELDGLKAFTDYTVQVMAYTVDYGVPSLQLNVTTAQDGKTVYFYLMIVIICWFLIDLTIKLMMIIKLLLDVSTLSSVIFKSCEVTVTWQFE